MRPITKNIFLSLFSMVMFATLSECALRSFYYQSQGLEPFAIGRLFEKLKESRLVVRRQSSDIHFEKPLFRLDSVLGYSFLPGVHAIEFRLDNESHYFEVTIDDEGRRITSPPNSQPRTGSKIWIFGGSITVGWGVNDDQTAPWIVQESFPEAEVVNYGGNGYGNVHGLLQLRNERNRGRKADVGIVYYYDFIRRRNSVTPGRLAQYKTWSKLLSEATHPRASLNRSGDLMIDYVRIFDSIPPGTNMNAVEHSDYWMDQVTIPVLAEMYKILRTMGAYPVLALVSGDDDLPVVLAAQKMGFDVWDIRVPVQDGVPGDGHPGPITQREYGNLLRERLALYRVCG